MDWLTFHPHATVLAVLSKHPLKLANNPFSTTSHCTTANKLVEFIAYCTVYVLKLTTPESSHVSHVQDYFIKLYSRH